MNDFVIMTDSSGDLPQNLIDELSLEVLPLSVSVDGKQYYNYPDGREISFEDFYKQVRDGADAKTSAVNVDQFIEVMEKILKEGKDVLYLGFSSGLSGTYSASTVAAEDLREKYPDRKIYTVDTLAASMGQGLLVYLAAKEKEKGKSIDEVRDFAENNKLNLVHWFTVNDLFHLKRGGRVSATTAVVGTMLNIKPVLHVDNEGKLINVAKAKGRKASIRALLEKMKETATNPQEQTIFISHGDCYEEAKELADMIKEEIGVKEVVINFIGPVIGAHAGPGTIALFFVGKER
ncbi:MAG: DegV family protein [Clostridiales bacterium]|nr:DegV family protein [Clostridiales bacterium]